MRDRERKQSSGIKQILESRVFEKERHTTDLEFDVCWYLNVVFFLCQELKCCLLLCVEKMGCMPVLDICLFLERKRQGEQDRNREVINFKS